MSSLNGGPSSAVVGNVVALNAHPRTTAQLMGIPSAGDTSGNPGRLYYDPLSVPPVYYTANATSYVPVTPPARLSKVTAVTMGDSRNALGNTPVTNYNANGHVVVLNQILGGRFDIRANTAVSGTTTGNLRLLQLPQVLAMSPAPSIAFIEDGYNDATGVPGGGATPTDAFANLSFVVAALWARGTASVLFTSQTGSIAAGTPTYLSYLNNYNNLLRTQGAQLPGVLCVIDAAGSTMNPITGSYNAAYYLADNTHDNYQGSLRVAGVGQPVLDPLLPRPAVFTFDVANVNQVIQNPRLNGTNANGANGFVLGGTNTGTGPDNYTFSHCDANLSPGGTAVGVISQVARTDLKAGTLVNIAHTGGANYESTSLAITMSFVNWSSGLAVNLTNRISPTSITGFQYRVVTAGPLATGSDPTATWSTVLGTQFTSGTAVLEVVPSINIGDSVQLVCEVFMSGFSGAALVVTQLAAYQQSGGTTGALITANYGNYGDQTAPLPTTIPTSLIIKTPPMVLQPTTVYLISKLFCRSAAGVTGTWQVGAVEVQKYV